MGFQETVPLGRAILPCLFLLAVVPSYAVIISSSDGLKVSVSSSGAYDITVPSPAWQFSGNVGSPLTNLSATSGSDAVGAYGEISFDFTSDAPRHAAIRSYSGTDAIVFTTTTPNGAPNSFAFPSFTRYPKGLSGISFSGMFAHPTFFATAEESPWTYFDAMANTFILSPAANYMVASTHVGSGGELATGISTRIATLPQGFTHTAILVVGSGINRTFDRWGRLITSLHGKTRPANDADVSLNKIGYWTDAGSTYYYATEPGLSYADTLAGVKADFDRQGIPLGYLQLDSWFYPKGPSADWSDRAGGIYEYFAATPPLSSTLTAFQQSLGIPLITHSRWIDASSPYRQQYKMSGNVSIDPLYWGTISRYLSNSGVAIYEQDWLSNQAQTNFNLTDADAFLDNMAGAFGQQGISMQYCMPTPRHFLESSKYDNLTTIRASQDRFDRGRWNDFLYASRLASALGIWPFADVLMSGETDNLLLATLSAGPVGVGDQIGKLNVDNLRRVVRADGVIVKPDVPLTPIDNSFLGDASAQNAPVIASTYTDFGELKAWYLFMYAQGTNTQALYHMGDLGAGRQVYLYDYFAGTGRVVNPGDMITTAVDQPSYQIAAPIGPSGIAVLGDTGQFVSLGKKRILSLTDDGSVHLTVAFAPGETERVIRGYAPFRPGISADSGSLGQVRYNRTSGQFSVSVMPGTGHTAKIHIGHSRRAPAVLPSTYTPL
jgi:hypothetical protein